MNPATTTDRTSPANSPANRWLAAAIAALVVAVGVGGWLLGSASAPDAGTPSELSAEAGFARDMQTHHNQAVQMSMIVRERTDNEEVRSLAYDIATTQANQSGQMYAWLELWGLPQTGDRPSMAWMEDMVVEEQSAHSGHSASHGPRSGAEVAAGHSMESMGMATPEELERLRRASGDEAARLYLTLMREHHTGGIAMAEAALARAGHPEVLELAEKMVVAQESEINAIDGLLERLG